MADEKLIGSLDRTRDAIQEQLIQLNRNIRAEFDTLISNLPEPEPAPAPPSPPVSSASLTDLLEAVDKVYHSTSQVELLKALVEGAGQFVPRALLLIKKAGMLHGWASCGFSEQFEKQNMKKVRWPVDQYAELKYVIENRAIHASGFNDLSDINQEIEKMDGFVPFKAIFLPLIVKNKVAALLYVDSGSEPQIEQRDKVQLLCHITGLELTLVAAKAKVAPKKSSVPAPESTDQSFASSLDSSVPAAPPQPAPVQQFTEPPPSDIPDFDPPADDFVDEEEVYEMVDDPADEPSFEPLPEPQFEVPEPVFEEPPAPPPPPEEEDTPEVKKAKRAARVLVSDLMLYNEAAVKAARQNGDLYQRLKEDIDRSYQHYKERISDLNSPSDRNFFKDEIIRQLGEGDPKILGPFPF